MGVVHIPNFLQIGQKNIEVIQICYRLALVGWSGQSKNSCIHFKLILFRFKPNISSQTNSNQILMKNTEVKKDSSLIGFGRSVGSVKK